MTSQTVYVLEKSGHNGDHAWTSIDTISFDLEKLEALRATRYSDLAAKKARHELIEQLKSDYAQQNPSPSWNNISEFGTIQKIPKWKAGLRKHEITQEMRDERDRITRENEEVSKAFFDAMSSWEDTRDAEIKRKLEVPEDFDLESARCGYFEEYEWDITERAFI
jgi:hypothetical protein